MVKRRIEAGEPFDVAILNPAQVEDLISQRKIVDGTPSNLGRAGLGVAVRAGAPKLELSSVEAFRQTLLDAKSVAYPEQGSSGAAFLALLDRLGITEAMKPKLKPAALGTGFPMVAKGEAEMMVTVIPQIVANRNMGIELAGPLPSELQTWIGLTVAVGVGAKEPNAARALVGFLTTPEAIAAMKTRGWEPIP